MAHTERKLKMDKNDWETACFMKRHYNALTSQVFEPGKTETAFSGSAIHYVYFPASVVGSTNTQLSTRHPTQTRFFLGMSLPNNHKMIYLVHHRALKVA
jgi:hypothetical protein